MVLRQSHFSARVGRWSPRSHRRRKAAPTPGCVVWPMLLPPQRPQPRCGRSRAVARSVPKLFLPTSLFTAPEQALATVLVATYVYAALFPGGAADVLALQPDKVVPRLWSLVTSSFYEWNAVSLLTHVGVVFTLGQRLERVWGAPEFLRFVLLVNACVGTATFVAMYALYMGTRDQYYLFTRFGGFQGCVAGLLVAWRQVAPDEAVFGSQLRAKHVLPLYTFTCLCLALLNGAEHHHIGLFLFVLFGAYSGWLYLRFFQTVSHAAGSTSHPSGGVVLMGDPRDEFSFAALWPGPLQIVVENVCSAPCYSLCCTQRRGEAASRGGGGVAIPRLSAVEVYRATVDLVNNAGGAIGDAAPSRDGLLAQRGSALLEQRMAQMSLSLAEGVGVTGQEGGGSGDGSKEKVDDAV